MKASAPGKLVISGAYSVLRGAPALVCAVSRRVYADSERPATFLAPEVTEGIRLLKERGPVGPPPWYDASELRGDGHKWGLGSSAAICVASLGALLSDQTEVLARTLSRDEFTAQLFPLAREAHRTAQGGGSGIDVAASCFGGTLIATLPSGGGEALPEIAPTQLPPDLHFEVWGMTKSASTADFVARVFALQGSEPQIFDALFEDLTSAAKDAVTGAQLGRANLIVEALKRQSATLADLGARAKVPIVLPEVTELVRYVGEDCAFLPSGAGGGDINLYVGTAPSSQTFRDRAAELDLVSLPLDLGAPGLSLS